MLRLLKSHRQHCHGDRNISRLRSLTQSRHGLACVAVLLLYAGLVPAAGAQKSGIYPNGVDVVRDKNWQFPCTSGDYSLVVFDGNTEEVRTAFATLKPNSDGNCLWPFSWKDSWRVSRGFLSLDRPYTWTVVDRAGNRLFPATRFATHPLATHTFSSIPPSLRGDLADWKIQDGYLRTDKVAGQSLLVFDLTSNIPGDAKVNTRALASDGTDIKLRIRSDCPEANCSIGLAFATTKAICKDQAPCRVTSWFELNISPTEQASVVRYVDIGTAKPIRKKLHEVPIYFDLVSGTEIRIIATDAFVRILGADGESVCHRLAESVQGRNFGVRWTSAEDDEGLANLQVDWLTAATSADLSLDVTDCVATLPTL